MKRLGQKDRYIKTTKPFKPEKTKLLLAHIKHNPIISEKENPCMILIRIMLYSFAGVTTPI